ncbi:hypothetical protein Pelo_4000 [Pelomyxa schiedti]|nr:hypothetical protein Pelo_4000 [Pelomyxa schiedti]
MVIVTTDLHFGRHIGPWSQTPIINALKAAATSPQDKVLIIAGDLVDDDSPDTLESAINFIKTLITDHKFVVIYTPGNHERKFSGKMQRLFEPIQNQSALQAFDFSYCDTITRQGDDVFISLCSAHQLCPRIEKKQLKWATQMLRSLHLESSSASRSRLHFITHYSMWSDPNDTHHLMDFRETVEDSLLVPFRFSSVIHAHRTKFTYGQVQLPKSHQKIVRLAAPTLNGKKEITLLVWAPQHLETEPKAIKVRIEMTLKGHQKHLDPTEIIDGPKIPETDLSSFHLPTTTIPTITSSLPPVPHVEPIPLPPGFNSLDEMMEKAAQDAKRMFDNSIDSFNKAHPAPPPTTSTSASSTTPSHNPDPPPHNDSTNHDSPQPTTTDPSRQPQPQPQPQPQLTSTTTPTPQTQPPLASTPTATPNPSGSNLTYTTYPQQPMVMGTMPQMGIGMTPMGMGGTMPQMGMGMGMGMGMPMGMTPMGMGYPQQRQMGYMPPTTMMYPQTMNYPMGYRPYGL